MKRRIAALSALALSLFLLAGCSQEEVEPLPEAMDQESVLAAGVGVLDQLLAGEYEAVYETFRDDIRANLTAEDVQNLVAPVFQEAGDFEKIETAGAEGSTEGEEHGIAEFRLNCSEEDVLLSVAFDPEMQLIGLSAGLDVKEWSFDNLVSNVKGLFGG